MGLSSDKGAVVTSVFTAMTTAAAKGRGHAVPDAIEGTKDVLLASWRAGNEEAKALDKCVLRMVHSACSNQLDVRATQLASRLTGAKAATKASQLASLSSRNAVHERIIQIMLIKKNAAEALAQATAAAPLAVAAAAAAPPPPISQVSAPVIATPPPQPSSSSSLVAPSTLPTTSSRSSPTSQSYEDTAMSSNSGSAAAGQSSSSSSSSSTTSSSLASRPFAKKTNNLSSPSRNVNNKRGLESLAAESPARVVDRGKGAAGAGGALFQPLLARQSSFAEEERSKRQKGMTR